MVWFYGIKYCIQTPNSRQDFTQVSSNAKWVIDWLYFAAAAAATSGSIAPAISLTEKAFKHLDKIRAERNEDLCLRIGVRQGGCSGMSYIMEFENRANASPDDSVIEYDGFAIGNFFILNYALFMLGFRVDNCFYN